MIYNDRQYSVSRAELAKLEAALAATDKDVDTAVWLRQANTNALREQIAETASEIADYDLLRSGQIALSRTSSLSELPRALIHARIARGMSQTELAAKLGMKPQQIQRYEATEYQSASLARLIEVSAILDVKVSESFESSEASASGALFLWTALSDVAWNNFPIKEMLKRNWFLPKVGETAVESTRAYFLETAGAQFTSALHRKKVRSGNAPNEHALLAWQARILDLAKHHRSTRAIVPFRMDDTWLKDLVAATREDRGPLLARDLLAEHGITLVIESHLPGTYLDGAAMLDRDGEPVIGLTLRHDRLDNFWFVLFHELGHVYLHLAQSLRFDFFDDDEGVSSDDVEKQADRFALDTLIPADLWDQCLSRFARSVEAVKNDAENLGVDESIIAGRIRKERNNYTILNDLVGNHKVRTLFEEAD